MYAPVIRKLTENANILIERSLPVKGKLLVKKDDVIKPFDKVGECVFSQDYIKLPKNFKINKKLQIGDFIFKGNVIGAVKNKPMFAEYNGRIQKTEDSTFIFQEHESTYNLLSGLWGTIKEVVEGNSVLINTQTKDLLMAASVPFSGSGELVVFPNPTEILEKHYLGEFSKNNEGKIIYVGHTVDKELIDKAIGMRVVAILAGASTIETFNYAVEKKFPLGLISGFGSIKTPDEVFNLLNIIAYRYVFFQGERNMLRIPVESIDVKKSLSRKVIKDVKSKKDVLILQRPYFGRFGVVDKVLDSSVMVKIPDSKEAVEIKYPNFYLVE